MAASCHDYNRPVPRRALEQNRRPLTNRRLPDLYVLGSYGQARKQVSLLNRLDDCCFGQRTDLFRPAGRTWDKMVGTTSFSSQQTDESERDPSAWG